MIGIFTLEPAVPQFVVVQLTLRFVGVAPWQYVEPPVKVEKADGYVSFVAASVK